MVDEPRYHSPHIDNMPFYSYSSPQLSSFCYVIQRFSTSQPFIDSFPNNFVKNISFFTYPLLLAIRSVRIHTPAVAVSLPCLSLATYLWHSVHRSAYRANFIPFIRVSHYMCMSITAPSYLLPPHPSLLCGLTPPQSQAHQLTVRPSTPLHP